MGQVELIDAGTDTHLWAGSYEGAAADVIALHDEVSVAVARAVLAHVAPHDAKQMRSN